MNLFNRLVMIVLIPIAALAVTLVLAAPGTVWQWLAWTLNNYALAPDFGRLEVRLLLLAIAAVLDLMLLFLFLFEIRRAPQRMVRVRRATGGEVRLPVDSIAERLAYHIDLISDVIDVQPRVKARSGAVDVHLFVRTAPDVDVPAKADEIINMAQWVVREKLGLTLAGEPKVELRVAPYPQSSKVETPATRVASIQESSR